MCLLGGAAALYALAITGWVLEAQWYGADGCAPQQAIISLTIIVTLLLSIISCTKIAPHGTLFTSAVVTAYATYMAYSALASHPDPKCNAAASPGYGHSTMPDFLVGALVFVVAIISMAGSAWSATSSKDALMGKSSSTTANSDLTVALDSGADSGAN